MQNMTDFKLTDLNTISNKEAFFDNLIQESSKYYKKVQTFNIEGEPYEVITYTYKVSVNRFENPDTLFLRGLHLIKYKDQEILFQGFNRFFNLNANSLWDEKTLNNLTLESFEANIKLDGSLIAFKQDPFNKDVLFLKTMNEFGWYDFTKKVGDTKNPLLAKVVRLVQDNPDFYQFLLTMTQDEKTAIFEFVGDKKYHVSYQTKGLFLTGVRDKNGKLLSVYSFLNKDNQQYFVPKMNNLFYTKFKQDHYNSYNDLIDNHWLMKKAEVFKKTYIKGMPELISQMHYLANLVHNEEGLVVKVKTAELEMPLWIKNKTDWYMQATNTEGTNIDPDYPYGKDPNKYNDQFLIDYFTNTLDDKLALLSTDYQKLVDNYSTLLEYQMKKANIVYEDLYDILKSINNDISVGVDRLYSEHWCSQPIKNALLTLKFFVKETNYNEKALKPDELWAWIFSQTKQNPKMVSYIAPVLKKDIDVNFIWDKLQLPKKNKQRTL